MQLHYQTSDHGCGRKSVQVFDENSRLIADEALVRDVDGWRVAGGNSDRPQHKTPEAAAKHFATILSYAING